MLSADGREVTMVGILHRAMNDHVPLEDVIAAGLLLRDPDFLRARAADEHDERARRRDREVTMAAGQRA
eukprot:4036486-Alexandrium_andersonii.AAC.1